MKTVIINLIIILIMPFIMLGFIKKTKAFWAGRKGVSLLQPFYDFMRLLKKGIVVSNTTSFIANIAPVIVLSSVIFAGLFVPLAGGLSVINIEYGFIIFAYLLGLSKFFALLCAMDTGSSFEGMGASREACLTSLIEPAFFIITASACGACGIYSFNSFNTFISNINMVSLCVIILAVLAFFIMLVVECSRIPVDDPATHLELTMIHEVMILDNSGFDLAVLTWASGIKMVLISSLILLFIIPSSMPYYISLILYLLLYCLIGIVVGTVESGIARIRMSHILEFVFAMTALALVILALITIRIYGG